MRTISADQQAIISSGTQGEHLRLSVKDSGGTFRFLGTYGGFNAIKSVTWSERVDAPHMICDIVILREMNKLSFAPMVETSPINKNFNTATAFSALIALTREVKVEVAITPMDRSPNAGSWMEVFRGRIDSIDSASGYDIKIGCRSLGGRLSQQFIKTELVYSYAAVSGVAVPLRIWEPQIPVVINVTYALPATRGTDDAGFNKFFKCSQSGTTGTSEPVWTTGSAQTDGTAKWDYVGAPTTSGNPVEQVMQNILNDHRHSSDATVTLYTPSSPSWGIHQFIQQREFVLDAISKLAKQIGWDLRFKWRPSSSQFELTFYQPTRSAPSVDKVFGVSDYENPTRLSVDIANIRNSWRVVYSDQSDLWPDGSPKRKTIEVSDPTSIGKYGELWAEIQEGEASQIDSSTEATILVNAALSDCKEPTAELGVVLTRGFPWVEVNDYYTFNANRLHFSVNQSLAVTGWTQHFDGLRLKTSLEVRGLPSIGSSTWIGSTVHPMLTPVSQNRPPNTSAFNGTQTPNTGVLITVGGASINTNQATRDKNRLPDDDMEIHLYTASGQTLDSGTLKHVANSATSSKTFSDLVPGKPYFGKTVARSKIDGKIVRGQPSAEFSFEAGRAKSGHYNSTSTQSHLPLNGNFEHASDDITNFPPDHWTVTPLGGETESYGLFGSVYSSFDSDKGRIMSLNPFAGERGRILCSPFEVRRGIRSFNIYASIRRLVGSGSGSPYDLLVDVFGYADAELSTLITNYTVTLRGDAGGPYPSINTWYESVIKFGADYSTIPNNVNFIQLAIRRSTAGSTLVGWDIGDVYVQEADFAHAIIDQLPWISMTLTTGWVNFGSTARYMKDSLGFVHLRGRPQRTSGSSAIIATLPVGYRPTDERVFAVDSANAYGRININSDGSVHLEIGTATSWASLDGIYFDTM